MSAPATPLFNRDLDAFCQKYMFSNRPVSLDDQRALPERALCQNKELFEQFLLFDTLVFKVTGENVPLAILISQFGIKGVEQLVEEGALRFVLWNQDVFSMVTDIVGVHPLAAGKHNSGAHTDPEQSAELGLRGLGNAPSGARLRRLVAKIVPLYVPQPDDLASDVVAIAHSAYVTGRLRPYGLDPNDAPLENVPRPKREQLRICSVELLEYKLIVSQNWTSLSKFSFLALFSESIRRLTSASSVASGFRYLSEIEQVPDFEALYSKIDAPLRSIPKIRAKQSSVRFRNWLKSGGDEDHAELTRRYLEAVGNPKGFFNSAPGKVVKSIVVTGAGVGLGAAIEGGLSGAAAGALAAKVLEPLADLGLDLLDGLVLEGFLRGWTPRMFFARLDAEYRRELAAIERARQ